MTIKSDTNDIWAEKNQREAFFKARALLEQATTTADDNLAAFKAIKASGQFDTLPTLLKTTMLAWETMFDDLKAAFLANDDVKDLYNWTP